MNIIKEIELYNKIYRSEIINVAIDFINSSIDPFSRDNSIGHITGSAWILDIKLKKVLLTHHKKLNIWIQPGGHSEGETSPLDIAWREGEEESGLTLKPLNYDIFHIDIHNIAEYNNTKAHKHFDLTYIFYTDSNKSYKISDESHDLKWVELNTLPLYTKEKNIIEMGIKSSRLIKSIDTTILNY